MQYNFIKSSDLKE